MTIEMVRLGQILPMLAAATAFASCADDDPGKNPQSSDAMSGVAEGCKPKPKLRQQQVLLACAPFSRGRELQVRTERDSGGREGCLEIYGMGGGKSRACGYVPYMRSPIRSSPIILDAVNQISAARPLEVYGTTAAEVAEVRIVSTDRGGKRESMTATLLKATDREALREAKLKEPFGYFVAELPPGSTEANATALAADGQPLKSIDLRLGTYRPPFVYARE